MANRLDEGTANGIYEMLLERFGEPLTGDKRLPTRQLAEGVATCEGCGGMMDINEDVCTQCGMMGGLGGMDETLSPEDVELSKGKKKTSKDDPRAVKDAFGNVVGKWGGETEPKEPKKVNEKAPPGRERQVKALKKQKGVKNPWAVAWSSYNKSH